MALDTLTFVLEQANVSLGDFAEAVGAFSEMVSALSKEVGTPDIEWIIEDLVAGSATASVRSPQAERAEAVVAAYARVGEAAAAGREIPYASAKRPVGRIIEIVDRSGEAARFETPEREFILRPRTPQGAPLLISAAEAEGQSQIAPPPTALGSVAGRIQTLSNRGSLRFTLYDLLYDKAVSCYLAGGQEEKLGDKWGKLASVEGAVARDPESGRPISIRQIVSVVELTEASKDAYLRSRRCSPPLTELTPEAAIRKLRDA